MKITRIEAKRLEDRIIVELTESEAATLWDFLCDSDLVKYHQNKTPFLRKLRGRLDDSLSCCQ